MKKSIRIFTFLLILVLAQSCTKAIIDEPSSKDLPELTRIIKYNPDVANIAFNHCLTCHAGSAPSGSLDLSTYESIRFQLETGTMWDRLNDEVDPMPPNGLLTPTNLQIIEKWVADGYLQN